MGGAEVKGGRGARGVQLKSPTTVRNCESGGPSKRLCRAGWSERERERARVGPERETVVVNAPEAVLGRAEGEAEPGGPAKNRGGEGAEREATVASDQGGNRAGPSVSGDRIVGERGDRGVYVVAVPVR